MGSLVAFDASGWLIVFARVGAILMLVPGFGEESIPPRVRLVIALLVALALYPIVQARLPVRAGDELALAVVSEAAIGLAIGGLVRVLALSLAVAGSIIATQTGFSMVVAFDPQMGGQSPALSRLLSLAGVVVLFSLNLHHLLLEGLMKSYDLNIPSMTIAGRDLAALATKVVAQSFEMSIQIALPFLVFGLVINVAMGLVARLAPSIQIFFAAQPAVLLAGIALLLACASGGIALWASMFEDAIHSVIG